MADAAVIELALRHCQGKAIVNSINLEDGEERFEKVCPLLHRYGGAVVVGCIDEDKQQGMAVTRERKLAIAERSYALLTEKYGVPARDLIFDPLVFPVGTGDVNYIGSAQATIEGVKAIKVEYEMLPVFVEEDNLTAATAAGRTSKASGSMSLTRQRKKERAREPDPRHRRQRFCRLRSRQGAGQGRSRRARAR